MEIDLYKADLFGASDEDLFHAVESFIQSAQEGYLLDFKEKWSDSALRSVAAFANTFGGLLLLGVKESAGRGEAIIGFGDGRYEPKTAISNAVASNITPIPPYELRGLLLPGGNPKHVCILRVRKGSKLHLITKKGEWPVYIRNQDQNIPADAASLQSLIATRAIPAGSTSAFQPVQSPIALQGFYVSEKFESGMPGQRRRSETFLQLQFVPEELLQIRLDLAAEQMLLEIIRSTYADVNPIQLSELRYRDWYQITYFNEQHDYEMRWAMSDSGAFHFITQVRFAATDRESTALVWSLADLMTNLDWCMEVTHQFWNNLAYPGEGNILAVLQVGKLPLLERGQGTSAVFASAFYQANGQRKRAKPLPVLALKKSEHQGERAYASSAFTYAHRFGNRAEAVTLMTNELLRDLGHAVKLSDLASLL